MSSDRYSQLPKTKSVTFSFAPIFNTTQDVPVLSHAGLSRSDTGQSDPKSFQHNDFMDEVYMK